MPSVMNVLSPVSNLSGGSKGPTNAQKDIASSQQDFMKTLQGDFSTAFAGNQNILNGLTKSMNTTLAAGPSQFGFSEPENTALKTLATSSIAQSYQNQKQAAGAAAAAAGGGAVLPNGSQGQTQAELASQAAQSTSNALLGIQEAGYKQGNANYDKAVSGLSTVAGLENPSGLASNANNAGEAAMSSANTIQKIQQESSPWAQVGGLVGSLAGKALNASVPGAGTALSSVMSMASPGTSTMENSLTATPQLPNPYASTPQAPAAFGYDPSAYGF